MRQKIFILFFSALVSMLIIGSNLQNRICEPANQCESSITNGNIDKQGNDYQVNWCFEIPSTNSISTNQRQNTQSNSFEKQSFAKHLTSSILSTQTNISQKIKFSDSNFKFLKTSKLNKDYYTLGLQKILI